MKTNTWPVQDAKARFSELLEAASKYGPQLVTKRGIETAMLVPIEEWNRMKENRKATLKELLLSPEARFEPGSLSQKRGGHIRKRPLVVFE
jgi:antitoxin Phd